MEQVIAARTVLVPKERGRETRVALVPTVIPRLIEAGWAVLVEPGAGIAAGYPDEAFVAHGAEIDPAGARRPDVVLGVRLGGASEDPLALERRLAPDTVLVGIADPLGAPEAIERSPTPVSRSTRWTCSRGSRARSRWTSCRRSRP